MKTNRKFVEVASRLLSITHRRYKEMCVLAVTGQLGGAQMYELNEHIATCDSCHEFLESVAQVSVQAMPVLAGNRAPAVNIVPPEGMRARFLSRLASQERHTKGGSIPRPYPDRVPAQKPFSVSAGQWHGTEDPIGQKRTLPAPISNSSPLLWRAATALAACAMIGIAGFYGGQWRANQSRQLAQARPSITASSLAGSPARDSDRVGQLEQQKVELERELARLKQGLSTAETERVSLNNELATTRDELAALTAQLQSASQRSSGELREAKNQVNTLQGQVDRLSQRLADSEVNLGVQRQTTEALTAKLETTEVDLQRERELKSAKLDLGDLVAARNLHIVDVYDADPNGKRQRSFGRVFYIEGKSLVFYAYDLEVPGRFKANVVFHVWGGKSGVKEVTHSLGILHKDDAEQSRWAMTFDDPKVLAQINSVFVTAESANKHYDQPHGKKVLYAYFGSPPNHP